MADVAELLSEALSRWGTPAAIAADRFKKSELIGHLNALHFPRAALVLRGQGYRDGSEDVRGFQLAALQRPPDAGQEPATPVQHGRGAAGGRHCGKLEARQGLRRWAARARAKDDVVAAAILAVAVGRRGSVARAGGPAYALAG